jgi:hypothetical protein
MFHLGIAHNKRYILVLLTWSSGIWRKLRHNTFHNDTQHNETEYTETQYKNTQHNQLNNIRITPFSKEILLIITPSITKLITAQIINYENNDT